MWTVFARRVLPQRVLLRWLAVGLVAGCGDPPARVALVPVAETCGRPAGATSIRVIAYGPTGEATRAVAPGELLDVADFRADTEQLGVEVVIGGGATGAVGKTAPLVFGELPDGAVLPVFMAPPGGFCPTVTPMTEPRVAPLVARAGDGALIVGGRDAGGRDLATAELYDPATGTFTPLEVPAVLAENGFAGTALATLPDGRVAISGGPQPVITLFDPVTRRFGASVLIEGRAFHATIATAADELLLAGGCRNVEAGACAGLVRNSSARFDVAALASPIAGPTLRAGRLGARMFDVGPLATGAGGLVIAGGVAPPAATDPSAADVLTLTTDATPVTGTLAEAALLDGGAVLTAFGPPGGPLSGAAAVIVPGVVTARSIASAPAQDGVRLIQLEDGRVIGLGGDPLGRVLVYDPTVDRWTQTTPAEAEPGAPAPGALTAPSLLRLADGSVLVVGGMPTEEAWIYRPELTGPATGSVTVVPGGQTRAVLTAPDPATVTRTPDWRLTVPQAGAPQAGAPLARALAGGPRMSAGSVRATVRVRAGAVALLARHVGAGEVVVAELTPGAPARLVIHADGAARVACSGALVPALDPATAVTLRLTIDGDTARLALGDDELVGCDVGPGARGAWGVAALGAGAVVTVDTLTIARVTR